MSFQPAFSSTVSPGEHDLFFVFRADGLLVKTPGAGAEIPRTSDLAGLYQTFRNMHFIGAVKGEPCFTAETGERTVAPEGMSFEGLRPLLGILDGDIFAAAGAAFQVVHWERTHRFCGGCGRATEPKAGERAKICPQCGLINYPKISPAVIVAIRRGREILLAHSARFLSDFYSVLAGFVEPGETFEECVKREVREEVGVEVMNIRYFGSQPWPFPNSLMVGFTADYADGEIKVDNVEISDARWFHPEALPPIPRTGTIARSLIDLFIREAGKA